MFFCISFKNNLTKLGRCDSYTIEWQNTSTGRLLGLLAVIVLQARTDRNARAARIGKYLKVPGKVPQSTYKYLKVPRSASKYLEVPQST